MSEIQPIENSYIDGIIKSPSPTTPVTTTQGKTLRDLVKKLRDRYEQEIGKVALLFTGIDSRIEALEDRYKGVFPSLVALQAAHSTAQQGDYANVDAGAGSASIRYVWDASDNAWIKGSGDGLVESVNALDGTVVLTTTEVADSADKRYVTDAQKTVLQNTIGSNTGDQDISGIATNIQATTTLQNKLSQLGASALKINTQTSSYVLNLTDAGKLIRMDSATANTVTIPTNSSVAFPYAANASEGSTKIIIVAWGTGTTTIVAEPGVILRSAGGKTRLIEQYSTATLIKTGTNEWLVTGDLATAPFA